MDGVPSAFLSLQPSLRPGRVSEPTWSPPERFRTGQVAILEHMTRGADPEALFNSIVALVERELDDGVAAIVGVNPTTKRLRVVSAPNLPLEYTATFDGLKADPNGKACTAAAWTGETTFAEDVTTDPQWATCREWMKPERLRSACSVPIFNADQTIVGTVDLYRRAPGRPSEDVLGLISEASHLACLALERYSSDATLTDAEAHYRQVIEQPGIFVHRFLPDTTEVFAGPRFAALLGVEPDALTGTKWIQHVSPERRSHVRRVIRMLTPDEPTGTYEFEMEDADGRMHWIQWHARGFFGPDGTLRYVQEVGVDLTERRMMEEAVRENESRFRQIAGGIDEVFWLRTKDEMLYISPAYDRVWGRPRQELYDDPFAFLDAAHPDDYERARSFIRGAYRDVEPVEITYRILVDEEVRWLRVRIRPIDTTNDPPRFVGVARNVTSQVVAEQELRRQKEVFTQVFDNVPVLLVLYDEDGTIDRINREAQATFGWTLDDVQSRDDVLDRLFPTEAARADALAFLTNAPDEWRDFPMQTRSGDVVQTAWTNVVLPDGKRIGIGLDVSSRRLYEEGLVEAKEQAEEANRLKSAMLSNMSHEVRTPLTSIIGFADLLRDELDGSHERFATLIHECGHRLMQTLDSVLQLSKLEADERYVDTETEMDLADVADEVVEEWTDHARNRGVTLDFAPECETCSGYWDRSAVRRITANLVDNAIKFTPVGGHVDVRVGQTSDEGWIEVADDGVGMSEGFQAKMFEAFKQESEGNQRSHGGNGVGLTIVQKLAALLQASIDVDSTKGEGTRVRVRLKSRSRNNSRSTEDVSGA